MADFKGVIIEESLEKKDVLRKVNIVKTNVEQVGEEHKTPWLEKWTLHTVAIQENQAENISKEISKSLDSKHGGSWYADFKSDKLHYIVFRGKIFKVDRSKPEQYKKVTKYGLRLGIPKYQVDFSPEIK
ncbi:MAG TPA: hypothetical protein VJA47_05535 [archaeon]|nr:hypothetical protein [archaeon]